jgi:hypothetical protein
MTRALALALPALIAAAVITPLPGTAGLHWAAEITGWAVVLTIAALLHWADELADNPVERIEKEMGG